MDLDSFVALFLVALFGHFVNKSRRRKEGKP